MVQKLTPPGSRCLVVGVTGSFGSGKSTVARMMAGWGAHVVDADKLAHEALRPDSPVYGKVAALLKEAAAPDGRRLDRQKIAGIVFRDPVRRKKLEALIHPYVFDRIREEVGKIPEGIILLEVPLLFETGFDRYCDRTLVVTAEPSAIERRLKEKGHSAEEIGARSGAQMPLEKKGQRAHFRINNSGTLSESQREAEKVFSELRLALKGETKQHG